MALKGKLMKVFRPQGPPPECRGGCGKAPGKSTLCPRIAEWLRRGEIWVEAK